jgi:sugar phosphate isomerase/epimerase
MNKSSRRTFLKTTAAVAAAACTGVGRLAAAPVKLPLGLQLYSVRELLPKDFEGTLKKLSAVGYKEVEPAGYYDKTAADFKKALTNAGLRAVSTHHPLDMFRAQTDELIEYGHNLGLEYIVCPSPSRRDPNAKGENMTLDDWHFTAEELNRLGEKVKAAGMRLGYHNHGPEFLKQDGVVFYDELLRLTDPKLVCFELDCGWAGSAGLHPEEYLKKTPERFPLLHVKDMVKGPNGEFHSTVMGRGVIDYKPILRAATGLKHYFIEQEEFDMDPIEALTLDAKYMKKLDI